MNNGKICVSVCAETADEFSEKIKRVRPLADFIELRFDCLKKNEFEKLDYPYDKNYIFTFRPNEQGGKRILSLREREDFWNSGNDFCGGDFEEDVVENHLDWLYQPVICSYHDFSGIPDDLFQIYERIKFANANIDVIKIAVQTQDIIDTIPIWKLLKKAQAENQKIIPIAMGECGKWTRILGLAHGAFMTYAALESGSETAPGQVSADDLIEVYRVKELDENAEVYGLLGSNTGVSLSPYIHNAAFRFHNLNAVFVPLQTHNLDEFIRRMVKLDTREVELNFRGFSVTIPHKQAIIKHLDHLDETAERIGAVNTVKIIDERLFGYNTDADGFIEPLKTAFGDLSEAKVAVLGAGGAARACIYALQKENAEVTIFARDPEKAEPLAKEFDVKSDELPKTKDQKPKTSFSNFDILINATPLGMKNKAKDETPVSADQLEGVKLVYDLVYVPLETRLIREAKRADVKTLGGLEMLVAQGAQQFKIWTEKDAPTAAMNAEALKRLK